MALNKSEITKKAIEILTGRGCFVWRQNNIAVRGRTFIGLKGVPDIIGFQIYNGIAVYCEVKTLTDRYSEQQKEFMNKASEAGCYCLTATEENGKVVLKQWN